jgi:shikimate kinase
MGSGKTAVGRLVAPRLGLRFIDIDDEVVREAGGSIFKIFRDRGESEFRRLESLAVRRVAGGEGGLITPGGGAVMDDTSWRHLLDGNLVVHLEASPRALLRRIRNRGEVRGLAVSRPREIRPLADVHAGARRWPAAGSWT